MKNNADYISHQSGSVGKKRAGRKFLTLASALVSLWLTSCVAPPPADARSDKLSAAFEATGRSIGDSGVQNGAGQVGGGKNSVGEFETFNRRVALVIGNSDYSNDIGRLANPTRDAGAIADALRRTGFEVSLLQNVTREEMLRAVLQFDRSLRDSDVGLFYYAGHAVQVNGRNFMIPTGADLDISSSRSDVIADYVALETVEIDDVLGRMGNAEADLNIVILDACRNNPFMSNTRGISRGLAQTGAPRGTFVAYATSPGKVAQDGDLDNSPYTAAIVRNLGTPGLKLEDVFKKVRQDVALQTNGEQIPWENSSVFGDFYFAEPEPEPEPVVVQPEPEPAPVIVEPKPEPQPAPVEDTEAWTAALSQPTFEPTATSELSQEEYREVQRLLARLGTYKGSITGKPDTKTKDAIMQWQTLQGLQHSGEISRSELTYLRSDAERLESRVEPQLQPEAIELPPLPEREPEDAPLRDPDVPTRWNQMIVPPPPA